MAAEKALAWTVQLVSHKICTGYLWWIIDVEKEIYAAIGNSGNVIYVNPEGNTVISVASTFKPTVMDRVDFIQEYVEPIVGGI